MRDSSEFVGVMRKRLSKISYQFKHVECTRGFGYYLMDESAASCSTYKLCQDWDSLFAIVTVNKCVAGKRFSLDQFVCLPESFVPCDANTPRFVPF